MVAREPSTGAHRCWEAAGKIISDRMKQKSSNRFNISKPTFGVRFLDFVNATLAYLSAKEEIDEAFALGEWLATYLWENISGIYRLDELEEILAAKLDHQSNYWAPSTAPRSGELHVATELYRAGGHTPLAANLIELAPTSVDVLLTRMADVQLAAEVSGSTCPYSHRRQPPRRTSPHQGHGGHDGPIFSTA